MCDVSAIVPIGLFFNHKQASEYLFIRPLLCPLCHLVLGERQGFLIQTAVYHRLEKIWTHNKKQHTQVI